MTTADGSRRLHPLAGVQVIEFPAIGPVPHCGLVLAELGAVVTRIDRPVSGELGIPVAPECDVLARGKSVVVVDLKDPAGRAAALRQVAGADILLEGFRPGVMERLGLGPAACHAANPALVYGRMSGWGDAGPLAGAPGHDLNYVGLTGALAAMGAPGEVPPVPLNLIGDFGGGAMQLALGVIAALLRARAEGTGCIVAASIYEAANALTPFLHGLRAAGAWTDQRHDNILDGGAPFYRCYEAADGRFLAVAAIEAKFFRALVTTLELGDRIDCAAQMDRTTWPQTTALLAACFAQRTRDAWTQHFATVEACVTPVLDFTEALDHPQARLAPSAPGAVRHPATAPQFRDSA